MKLFLLNLLLALLWGAVSGSFGLGSLIAGFIFGYLILLLARPAFGPRAYHGQVWRAIALAGFFVKALVVSSIRVARDVLTPGLAARPAVVAYPLEVKSDVGITVLSSFISLTPGTLSMDVSSDRSTLYVHAMYDGDDLDLVRHQLREIELRVRDILEPPFPYGPEHA
jgi:multicomponent Na+:H+ antiporter subunit E